MTDKEYPMILIKRKNASHYVVYNIAERFRPASWSATIEQAINNRFNRSSLSQYSDISLKGALKLGGNNILWYIPISGPITEEELKVKHPELFI